MRVALCIDDKNGMLFNHRRQSRDRVLIADLLESVGEGRLYIGPFSQKLMESYGVETTVSENMLCEAGESDLCFVEDMPLSDVAHRIDELIIYRWNRVYPADVYLDIDIEREGFRLTDTVEFEGSSHEKITKETYRR
jgi:hypothetical protein